MHRASPYPPPNDIHCLLPEGDNVYVCVGACTHILHSLTLYKVAAGGLPETVEGLQRAKSSAPCQQWKKMVKFSWDSKVSRVTRMAECMMLVTTENIAVEWRNALLPKGQK